MVDDPADSPEDYYFGQDHLYSTAVLFDDTGAVVERYEYCTYGNPHIMDASYNSRSSSNYENPYLFTGRRLDILDTDGSLKIYYYRARYYDPQTGRFLQRDPLDMGLSGAMFPHDSSRNLYEYCASAPAVNTDPSGLRLVPIEPGPIRPSPVDPAPVEPAPIAPIFPPRPVGPVIADPTDFPKGPRCKWKGLRKAFWEEQNETTTIGVKYPIGVPGKGPPGGWVMPQPIEIWPDLTPLHPESIWIGFGKGQDCECNWKQKQLQGYFCYCRAKPEFTRVRVLRRLETHGHLEILKTNDPENPLEARCDCRHEYPAHKPDPGQFKRPAPPIGLWQVDRL